MSKDKTYTATLPTVAFVGNPNVGKSSVFNLLTGMHNHTGNWSGKTVTSSVAKMRIGKTQLLAADLPGAYSLSPCSAEEQATRDFIVFCNPDAIVYVCAASTLERSLIMLTSVTEFCDNVVLCVNMTDELASVGGSIDADFLAAAYGIPVVCVSAKKKKGINALKNAILQSLDKNNPAPRQLRYPDEYESILEQAERQINELDIGISPRGTAIRFLCCDGDFLTAATEVYPKHTARLEGIYRFCAESVKGAEKPFSEVATARTCEFVKSVCAECISESQGKVFLSQLKADRILTGKFFAFPAMLLLLALIFFITLVAANAPSDALSTMFSSLEAPILRFLYAVGLPDVLCNMLVFGVFRVVGWVISVMLPAMAIFFPLFTLLEDSGYLPRIAFNLDAPFCACGGCGKQALTMCMGFGCNAVGVSGCRIIGSERERLVAILTNAFSPCNGRFPILIAIITMFCPFSSSALRAVVLSSVILFSVLCAMAVSKLLSATILRGTPSSYIMEMPPYRMPKVGEVIVRSLVMRTAGVLARAVCIAAPCGLIIWLLANITAGGHTLLYHISDFLDPAARLFGMDGVILFAFILGTPANEIVIPIMLMCYMGTGEISSYSSIESLREIFVSAGWTLKTAVCTLVFAMMHHPCAATLATVYRETKSAKYTLLSAIVPAGTGLVICFIINMLLSTGSPV